MSLREYVRAMGRGPSRGRSLSAAEAEDAMAQILAGTAAPEAVGALLMLMRYRGETPEELAGFTLALRATLPDWSSPAPALDWPSFAAGRTRGLPWFLLSARLLAEAGHPVLLHGWNSHQGVAASVTGALAHAGIRQAKSLCDAGQIIADTGIAYLSLADYAPRALELLQLRDVLGLRSAVNTVLRLVNPAGAPASVQGVFHPPYLALQSEAALLLGLQGSCVIKGGGGEFERNPAKSLPLSGICAGALREGMPPALLSETHARLADGPQLSTSPDALAALWSGDAEDSFAEAIVTGTAALALLTMGRAASPAEADAQAQALWAARALATERTAL
ncbi:glycosyl transferase family protein [Aliiruegeria sabulilitoris]|uniref:glycosyl transferase family protein n=1 Tax=Aliiruegeria sabulilitoris TaxID=1510458 RepID=UPI00082D8587|nr:glycosyl transferase family protein [Aliiruegeria sabulilitoris]NDR56143.1 glycosyl transferase family protein [Pseudoruegeria sp. M32A2M]